MLAQSDLADRAIRLFQDGDFDASGGVCHKFWIAAYTYLRTWQSMTLETAIWVVNHVILPKCQVWVGLLDEKLDARKFYERHGFVAGKFGISPPPESAPDVESHWRPSFK